MEAREESRAFFIIGLSLGFVAGNDYIYMGVCEETNSADGRTQLDSGKGVGRVSLCIGVYFSQSQVEGNKRIGIKRHRERWCVSEVGLCGNSMMSLNGFARRRWN